jgi:hypothetical protein
VRRDRLVALVGHRRRHLDERALGLAEAEHLRDVQLVEAERPRHARIDLQEERHAPDERGDVLGVGPEAHVAMAIGRCGGGDHERATRARAQQRGELGEVVGHEVAAAVPVRLARRGGEEVGDVTQVRRVLAVDVRPLVQGVHLVQAHVLQALVVGLERVDERDGLAVDHGDDDVGPGSMCASTSSGDPTTGARTADGTSGSLGGWRGEGGGQGSRTGSSRARRARC